MARCSIVLSYIQLSWTTLAQNGIYKAIYVVVVVVDIVSAKEPEMYKNLVTCGLHGGIK